MTIFGRHHIRANFYHFVSMLYVLTMVLWLLNIMPGNLATWLGFGLFIADYLAEMYDPHPENPGTWFQRHFHRFLDDIDLEYDEEDLAEEYDLYLRLHRKWERHVEYVNRVGMQTG